MNRDNTEICPCCNSEYIKDLPADAYFYDCCEDCSFWIEKLYLPEQYQNKQVIVNGIHYLISNSSIKGYAGAKFKIKFFDGRVIKTSNLWQQGRIPQHFRSILKDNAVFIKTRVAPTYAYDDIPF
ncbi:MAG: hypothetical protein HQK63_15500 [Desulfamplus sp.]|nr:hypothetical protein [Desulfamplus sp.]